MALYYIAAFTAVRALPSAFDRARSAEKDFDVLRHTGGSDGPRVLFVGGNPGVARFYAAAAQELADATSGDVAVLGWAIIYVVENFGFRVNSAPLASFHNFVVVQV